MAARGPMSRLMAGILAAAALASTASATPVEPRSSQFGPAPSMFFCSIKISFGSIGTGINRAAAASILEHIRASKTILRAISQPWGREGELTICLTTFPLHTDREAATLQAILDKNPMPPPYTRPLTHIRIGGRR